MIRLRVSDLDSWMLYVEPALEVFELSTEQLLARLRREEAPTDDMRAGSAFHGVLEHAKEGEILEGVERGGFTFHFDGRFALELPHVCEPEIMERVFDTPAGPALLRGRIDGRYRSRTVVDYKLSKRFDAERYARSLQWRSYLLMTGERRFLYKVFQSKRKDANVYITDVHDFEQWAYEGMEAEVHQRVSELAEFVAAHVPSLVTDDEPAGPVEAMAAEAKRLAEAKA